MKVRKIKEAEYARTLELFAVAFESPLEPDAVSPRRLEEIKQAPACREERYWQERWAAFDDAGAMMGFLIGFPATVRFDGKQAACTCVGGVSTLPQYRGRGAIAGCFRRHLEDSYWAGHVFSYLYPFSTVFYRQFGYALCAETVEWTFETAVIPPFPDIVGEAVLNEGSAQQTAIAQVYAGHMAKYNLSFVREACDWNRLISRSPATENRFTYVWRNHAGIPKGVLGFHKQYDAGSQQSTMQCDAFYYTDAEGLQGLLQHIRSYRSHIQWVKLSLPKDAALECVLPEVGGRCRRELQFTGMGRVIHAQRALELACYRGSGQVSLKLTDPCIMQNNKAFRVTYENGACTRVEESETYDTEMDIGTFTRLLLGNCNDGDVQGEALAGVFYPKKLFICDFF